ncbi:MAG: ATP-binding protein, partial [Actinomycetes bacterium]
MTGELLERCVFPVTEDVVALAVSGGADSVGMALLAHEAGLALHIHHVNHHLRPDSARDAELVVALAR